MHSSTVTEAHILIFNIVHVYFTPKCTNLASYRETTLFQSGESPADNDSVGTFKVTLDR